MDQNQDATPVHFQISPSCSPPYLHVLTGASLSCPSSHASILWLGCSLPHIQIRPLQSAPQGYSALPHPDPTLHIQTRTRLLLPFPGISIGATLPLMFLDCDHAITPCPTIQTGANLPHPTPPCVLRLGLLCHFPCMSCLGGQMKVRLCNPLQPDWTYHPDTVHRGACQCLSDPRGKRVGCHFSKLSEIQLVKTST